MITESIDLKQYIRRAGRQKGKTINAQGYVLVMDKEHPNSNAQGYIREHVLVVEKVIGKYLPPTSIVHHVDKNKRNNDNNNLVVCQDDTYHKLIHRRMRALSDCGNANFRKCRICKCYDHPDNINIQDGLGCWHTVCHAENEKKRYHNKKANKK